MLLSIHPCAASCPLRAADIPSAVFTAVLLLPAAAYSPLKQLISSLFLRQPSRPLGSISLSICPKLPTSSTECTKDSLFLTAVHSCNLSQLVHIPSQTASAALYRLSFFSIIERALSASCLIPSKISAVKPSLAAVCLVSPEPSLSGTSNDGSISHAGTKKHISPPSAESAIYSVTPAGRPTVTASVSEENI